MKLGSVVIETVSTRTDWRYNPVRLFTKDEFAIFRVHLMDRITKDSNMLFSGRRKDWKLRLMSTGTIQLAKLYRVSPDVRTFVPE